VQRDLAGSLEPVERDDRCAQARVAVCEFAIGRRAERCGVASAGGDLRAEAASECARVALVVAIGHDDPRESTARRYLFGVRIAERQRVDREITLRRGHEERIEIEIAVRLPHGPHRDFRYDRLLHGGRFRSGASASAAALWLRRSASRRCARANTRPWQ